MLTKKQHKLMVFIQVYMRDNKGVAPSFDDMAAGIGNKSRSSMHNLMVRLEERGFIKRMSGHARAIEIVKRVKEK